MIKLLNIFFLLTVLGFAQQSNKSKPLWDLYSDFKYRELLNLSSRMVDDSTLTRDEKTDIYLLRGISLYNLNRNDSVRSNFIEILNIDPEYKCDSSLVPPKIISYFNEVKAEYYSIVERSANRTKTDDEVEKVNDQPSAQPVKITENKIRSTIWRSVLLPGWGQLYNGNNSKGWLLTGASVTLLGGVVYFAVDTQRKEKLYLNESEWEQIEEKYKSYNSSYKFRNAFIAGYVLIWLYSQYDVLFGDSLIYGGSSGFDTQLNFQGKNTFDLKFSIPLN